jgi:signal transduction histidine kinase
VYGADRSRGSGLSGLADRVAALDGTITVDSPRGAGTTVRAEIPYAPHAAEPVSLDAASGAT